MLSDEEYVERFEDLIRRSGPSSGKSSSPRVFAALFAFYGLYIVFGVALQLAESIRSGTQTGSIIVIIFGFTLGLIYARRILLFLQRFLQGLKGEVGPPYGRSTVSVVYRQFNDAAASNIEPVALEGDLINKGDLRKAGVNVVISAAITVGVFAIVITQIDPTVLTSNIAASTQGYLQAILVTLSGLISPIVAIAYFAMRGVANSPSDIWAVILLLGVPSIFASFGMSSLIYLCEEIHLWAMANATVAAERRFNIKRNQVWNGLVVGISIIYLISIFLIFYPTEITEWMAF